MLINCNDCTLCPLLVTAISFPEVDTAIFSGRSPRGIVLPAGVRLQPFGSLTRGEVCALIFKRNTNIKKQRRLIRKIRFINFSGVFYLFELTSNNYTFIALLTRNSPTAGILICMFLLLSDWL